MSDQMVDELAIVNDDAKLRKALAFMCILGQKGDDTEAYELIEKLYARNNLAHRSIFKVLDAVEVALARIKREVKEIAKCKNGEHTYGYCGEIPCTGVQKCIYCGKRRK